MNIENKKQWAIILFATALGIIATLATGNYVQTTIQEETKRRAKTFEEQQMKPLKEEVQAMRQQISMLASRPVAGPAGAAAAAAPKAGSLSLVTPPGKRAYTVRIEPLKAVGGMINAGDFVDILGHLNVPDALTNKKDPVSTMVFQNVKVLAVGTNLQPTGGYDQQQSVAWLNITFALTPEEASLMSFIEKNGQMQLVLRPPSEEKVETLQKADWQNLADYVFNKQGTEIATPKSQANLNPSKEEKSSAKDYIEIIKGGQRQ